MGQFADSWQILRQGKTYAAYCGVLRCFCLENNCYSLAVWHNSWLGWLVGQVGSLVGRRRHLLATVPRGAQKYDFCKWHEVEVAGSSAPNYAQREKGTTATFGLRGEV